MSEAMAGGFFERTLGDSNQLNGPDTVLAIGNFDGVHRGHQAVLERAITLAKEQGLKACALSFEPHPRTLFKPQSPVFRLTPSSHKARVLKAFGLNGLFVLPFTRDIAGTDADTFVKNYLVDQSSAKHVVTGFNFHFGKGRQGSPQFLKDAGDALGFGVTIVEPFVSADDETISSSRIRRALGAADMATANRLLGYRWCVTGTVASGAKLGRTLGYPTANISLPESCHLAHGIYAVRLRRADGSLHNGVASYGRRPTFDNGEALLETFVFDFDDDLYGEQIEVSLFSHIRDEVKFDSAEALVVQMDRDSEQARKILNDAVPLSPLDEKLTFKGLV